MQDFKTPSLHHPWAFFSRSSTSPGAMGSLLSLFYVGRKKQISVALAKHLSVCVSSLSRNLFGTRKSFFQKDFVFILNFCPSVCLRFALVVGFTIKTNSSSVNGLPTSPKQAFTLRLKMKTQSSVLSALTFRTNTSYPQLTN